MRSPEQTQESVNHTFTREDIKPKIDNLPRTISHSRTDDYGKSQRLFQESISELAEIILSQNKDTSVDSLGVFLSRTDEYIQSMTREAINLYRDD